MHTRGTAAAYKRVVIFSTCHNAAIYKMNEYLWYGSSYIHIQISGPF